MLWGRLLVRTDLAWLNFMFVLQKGITQVMSGATRLAYGMLGVSLSSGCLGSIDCNSTTTSVFLNFLDMLLCFQFIIFAFTCLTPPLNR